MVLKPCFSKSHWKVLTTNYTKSVKHYNCMTLGTIVWVAFEWFKHLPYQLIGIQLNGWWITKYLCKLDLNEILELWKHVLVTDFFFFSHFIIIRNKQTNKMHTIWYEWVLRLCTYLNMLTITLMNKTYRRVSVFAHSSANCVHMIEKTEWTKGKIPKFLNMSKNWRKIQNPLYV